MPPDFGERRRGTERDLSVAGTQLIRTRAILQNLVTTRRESRAVGGSGGTIAGALSSQGGRLWLRLLVAANGYRRQWFTLHAEAQMRFRSLLVLLTLALSALASVQCGGSNSSGLLGSAGTAAGPACVSDATC